MKISREKQGEASIGEMLILTGSSTDGLTLQGATEYAEALLRTCAVDRAQTKPRRRFSKSERNLTLNQMTADDEFFHVLDPFVNLYDLGITIKPANIIFINIAISSM